MLSIQDGLTFRCGKELTLSLLMATQETFRDIVYQDQTALNVQSDL